MSSRDHPDSFKAAVRVLANLVDRMEPDVADVNEVLKAAVGDSDLPLAELAHRIILREIYPENSGSNKTFSSAG